MPRSKCKRNVAYRRRLQLLENSRGLIEERQSGQGLGGHQKESMKKKKTKYEGHMIPRLSTFWHFFCQSENDEVLETRAVACCQKVKPKKERERGPLCRAIQVRLLYQLFA